MTVSELKIYAANVYEGGEVIAHGADVVLYSAHLKELAALREELVLAKDTAASWKYSADGLAEEAREIDKRLTAAEQRNALLISAIVSLPDEFKELSGCENTAGVYACIEHISEWVEALTKPTESGASEAERKEDDEALQRRHDQERAEYFNDESGASE